MSESSTKAIDEIIRGVKSADELTSLEFWQMWRQLSEPERGYLQAILAASSALSSGSALLDAAGRSEVSVPEDLGDYTVIGDDLPLLFDKVTNGTGAIAHNATTNSVDLSVTSNGDYAIYQTKQHHPCLPGRAQKPEFTFINLAPETDVVKRVGYYSSQTTADYDTLDGLYLESSNGTVKFCIAKGGSVTVLEQAEWNPEYQTGINWANFQACFIDFLYLGGAAAKLAFIFNDRVNLAESHLHVNEVADVIVDDPAQPIRAEIRSTGGAGTLKFCCATVTTGGTISAAYGTPFSIGTGAAVISGGAAGTRNAAIIFRKTNRFRELIPSLVSIASSGGANNSFAWKLHINPTLSGAPSYSPHATAPIEVDVTNAVTVTADGAVIVDEGNGTTRGSSISEISRAIRIGATIAGVYDVMALEYTPLDNGTSYHAVLKGVHI